MKVGYIRTSKKDQNPELQRRDLLAAGFETIFEEQISSRKADWPELRAAMEFCREEDELIVWKLDRFGRSLQELIELVSILKERGVEFVSLRESLDTTTPGGKLVFHVFGAVAEFERDIIQERTMAGLEAARARGRKGGRKPVMNDKKIARATKLMKDRETPISEVCEAVGVSKATIYRYLEPDGKPRERGKTQDGLA
jgi:DNA invertase Pin-like site-specific DNA recombinase